QGRIRQVALKDRFVSHGRVTGDRAPVDGRRVIWTRRFHCFCYATSRRRASIGWTATCICAQAEGPRLLHPADSECHLALLPALRPTFGTGAAGSHDFTWGGTWI